MSKTLTLEERMADIVLGSLNVDTPEDQIAFHSDVLEHLRAVQAEERERCARVCVERAHKHRVSAKEAKDEGQFDLAMAYEDAARVLEDAASAIRGSK